MAKRRLLAALAFAGALLLGAPLKTNISWDEAKPVVDAFPKDLPAELKGKSPAQLEAAWPAWVSRSNAEIRARLERGDEDSIFNFWLYGTSFTKRPRMTNRDVANLGGPAGAADLLQGRLNDLLTGIANPGANDRLRFVREVMRRHGIDPTTPAGRDEAWNYMVDLRARAHADNDRYVQAGQSAQQLDDSARQSAFATLFHDRGLSSDTRLDVDFSIDQALKALGAKGSLKPGSIRRVAIVGPGLDFTDKAEGYDFYPQQTIQPFAVLDSLLRLSLAASADLHMTTFDLSPRVNQHLEAARQRAQSGTPYVLQLPLDGDSPAHQWNPDFEAYWQHVGARIGDDVPAIPSPPGASVRVRAVRVRPAMALSITPRDLNIVLERLAPLNEDDRFDLIIATNVLIYYNAFEQALALANVSAMLRPGGVFLTNYKIAPLPPVESSGSVITSFDRQGNGDTIFVYVRR
jgi:SAM-dependent methyltransferase